MKKIIGQHRRWAIALFVALSVSLLIQRWAGNAYAFQPTKKITVSAGTKTGGVPIVDVLIDHVPIQGVSPITRDAIIQGAAGTNPFNLNVSFPGRITSFDQALAAEDYEIRVSLYFRVIIPGDPADPPFELVNTLVGPDPTPFAFQIEPEILGSGQLQYKIKAEMYRLSYSTSSPVGLIWYPPGVNAINDGVFVSVDVQGSAQELIGASGGRILVVNGNPNVGNTVLDIPSGILTGNTSVTLDELDPNNPLIPPPSGFSEILSVFNFDSDRPFNGNMLLSLLYNDFEFPLGPNGILDGTESPVTTATIFWWDGFKWRPIGGKVNSNSNLVSARINQKGFYVIASAAPIAPADRRPMKKIITPNGDGINDTAIFAFGGVVDNVSIEIFDIAGHRIRSIQSAFTFEWDGRDDSGRIVESGAYLYQYKLEGQLISGLIAVAK